MPMSTRAVGEDDQDAPILVELRLRLQATDDPVERSALRIRQALYLARTNRLQEAQSLPDEMRATWAGQEELRVFVWLWILEGVLDFYKTSRTGGRARLMQACAAADKAGYRPEAELAAAWLAHLAYVDNDFPAMSRWLLASGLGTAALDESVARSSLTLACALQLFGLDAAATTWFARAREVARRTGDRAGIMAATANRVMLKLNDSWLDHVFGQPPRYEPESLRQELMGILGYERLSGSESLTEQNEVAQLRMAVLRGDMSVALTWAQSMSSARERHSTSALAMADVVLHWLQARQDGTAEEALRRSDALQAAFSATGMDDDDAAGCLALMAQLARQAGLLDRARMLSEQAVVARQRFTGAIESRRQDLLELEREAAGRWNLS